MPYIIDIETRPSEKLKPIFFDTIKPDSRLKDPAKIAADIEEKKADCQKALSLDHDFSEIVCVGVKPLGKDGVIMTFDEFVAWLNVKNPLFKGNKSDTIGATMEMITFNGKNFDLPVLIKYAIRKGYTEKQFPYKRFLTSIDRYKAFSHIDLQEKLQLTRDSKYKSLDLYLKIYLNKQKKEINFATATEAEIRAHCLEDIGHTEELYLLMKDRLFID